MKMSNPIIGIGIITYNREDFFKKCFDSVKACLKKFPMLNIVAINDGSDYNCVSKLDECVPNERLDDCLEGLYQEERYIRHKKNMGVAVTKNRAFQELWNCDYIFLIEDDIIIKDPEIISKYIELHEITGIHHFNFGYHGPANKSGNQPNPKLIINYGDKKFLIWILNLKMLGNMLNTHIK
jgi:glycosyltransferase involved in cell wall biosynthesis